ncbi:MAG: STAS domain-containing protein [Alistipes sp.]
MKATITKIDGRTTVVINGRLDTVNAKAFEEQIQPILQDTNPDVIIDCTSLQYISSNGLRLFITLLKHAKSTGGVIEVCNLSPEVKEVFDMTGFSAIFNIQPTS